MPKLFNLDTNEPQISRPTKVSVESLQEDINTCKKVIDKLNVIRSNSHTKHNYTRDIAYVNNILLKYKRNPLRIANEDGILITNMKVDIALSEVNELSNNLDLKAKEMSLIAQERDIQANREKEATEVEPIRKYPLNEKTLTTYAITSPNLLSATAAAIKVGDTKEDAPTIVSTAKTVLEDAATNDHMAEVVREDYDYSKDLAQNVVRFYNSPKGRKWLMSREGQDWINYVISKPSISKEEDKVDTSESEVEQTNNQTSEDDLANVIISMENNLAEANYLVNEIAEKKIEEEEEDAIEEILAKQSDQTEEVLSDNADKITRLENTMDLVAAGINSVDHIQASSSVTVESAKLYNNILQQLAIDSAAKVGHEIHISYNVSAEDMKFDPAGSLSISRESLMETLTAIYEWIKKMISKAIDAIKSFFSIAKTRAKLVAAKSNRLINKIKNKGPLTQAGFDTITTRLVEKYRPILYMLDYKISNGDEYLTNMVKSPIRQTVTQPLREIYGYLNKLNSNINANKEQAIGGDLDNILKIMHPDNIMNKVFSGRSKYLVKFDDAIPDHTKIDAKSGTTYTLFVSNNKALGITYKSENAINGKEVFKYDLVKLKVKDLEGMFKQVPDKSELIAVLNNLRNASNNMEVIYREASSITDYSKTFISSFKKFRKSHRSDSLASKDITSVITSIVSYAKTVAIKYASNEISNYIKNCVALYNICDMCYGVME